MLKVLKTHKDKRGEIAFCEMNGVKFNVLYTKEGYMRGGDIHPNTQYDTVLKGAVDVERLGSGREFYSGETVRIAAGVPHMFRAITDLVMMEWWDGPFKARYYQPLRKLIDEQLKKRR